MFSRTPDREAAWSENAKGVPSISPGLPSCEATLGGHSTNDPNPERVESNRAQRNRERDGFNPFRVDGVGGIIDPG